MQVTLKGVLHGMASSTIKFSAGGPTQPCFNAQTIAGTQNLLCSAYHDKSWSSIPPLEPPFPPLPSAALDPGVTFTIRFVDSCPDTLLFNGAPVPAVVNMQFFDVESYWAGYQLPYAGFNHGHCVGAVNVNPNTLVPTGVPPQHPSIPTGAWPYDIAPTALFNCGGPDATVGDKFAPPPSYKTQSYTVLDASIPNLAFVYGQAFGDGEHSVSITQSLAWMPQGNPFYFESYYSPSSRMYCLLLVRRLPPNVSIPGVYTKEYFYYQDNGVTRNIRTTFSDGVKNDADALNIVMELEVQWGVISVGALPSVGGSQQRGTAQYLSTDDYHWSAFANCVLMVYIDSSKKPMVAAATTGQAYCNNPRKPECTDYADCCGANWAAIEESGSNIIGNFTGCLMALVSFDFTYDSEGLKMLPLSSTDSNPMLTGLIMQLGVTEAPNTSQCLITTSHDCGPPAGKVPGAACVLADTQAVGPIMCPVWCQPVPQNPPPLVPPGSNPDPTGMYGPTGYLQCYSNTPAGGVSTSKYYNMVEDLLQTTCQTVKKSSSSWPCYGGAAQCSGLGNSATGPQCRHALKFKTSSEAGELSSNVCKRSASAPINVSQYYECACANADTSPIVWPHEQGGIGFSFPEFAKNFNPAALIETGFPQCWWPSCTAKDYLSQTQQVWPASPEYECAKGVKHNCITRIASADIVYSNSALIVAANACGDGGHSSSSHGGGGGGGGGGGSGGGGHSSSNHSGNGGGGGGKTKKRLSQVAIIAIVVGAAIVAIAAIVIAVSYTGLRSKPTSKGDK